MKIRDETCYECGGDGWVYDNLGGCADPDCCGSPIKVQCRQCKNDWSADNEGDQ